MLGGSLAVLGLLAGAVALSGSDDRPRRGPQGAAMGVQGRTAEPWTGTPEAHPTFGKYVPPRPVGTAAQQEPKPKAKTPVPSASASMPPAKPSRPKESPRPRPRRSAKPDRPECPDSWRYNPFMRRWCEHRGYHAD